MAAAFASSRTKLHEPFLLLSKLNARAIKAVIWGPSDPSRFSKAMTTLKASKTLGGSELIGPGYINSLV